MNQKQLIWFKTSLIVLLLGVVSAFIWINPCPSSSQYAWFQLILALGAGTFIMLFTGSAKIILTETRTWAKLTGAAAMVLLIYYVLPRFSGTSDRCSPTQHYTIFLRTVENRAAADLKGSIRLKMGNEYKEKEIGSDGTVHFYDLPVSLLQKPVTIDLKAHGWWFHANQQNTLDTLLPGENMILSVSRDETYSIIKGKIFDSDNVHQPLVSVRVQVADTTVFTDADGGFQVQLPQHKRKPSHHALFDKDGYQHKENAVEAANERPQIIYLQRSRL